MVFLNVRDKGIKSVFLGIYFELLLKGINLKNIRVRISSAGEGVDD